MGDQNPWQVESIEAFSFYCCPECDLKTKTEDYFKMHAIECHNKSKAFFRMLQPGNTTNVDPLEVETEFECQEENEKGMEKFGESETSVKEESLSESEGEVKKSEHKSQALINNGPDLESIDDYETADFLDDQEADSNYEELETFHHDLETEGNKEQAKIFNKDNYGITEEKNMLNEEKKKRKRDSIVEREKKKKKLKAILGMEDHKEIGNQKIPDCLGNDPESGSDADFDTTTDEESDGASNKKRKKMAKSSPVMKSNETTPSFTKNYQTLKEKRDMRAILEKEDTEEVDTIKNKSIQDCLGDELFVAKSDSDSATKKSKKIAKSMPCTSRKTDVYKPKVTKNFLSLEEKLEIIKWRENGVSSTKIGRYKNIAESSVRTIYGQREKLKFQATLTNPSQKRTRSMDKMETLLTLWIQDLNKRRILIGLKQIQAKAKSLYLHVKENFEDKTEAEMKETFGASNGWFERYKKRHNIKNVKITGNAKSGNHYEVADYLDNNLNTIDDQEAESNFEELETFHHGLETEGNNEQAKIFDADNHSITGEKNMLKEEEEKKRKRDLDIERKKKKKKLSAILGMEDIKVDPIDFENQRRKKFPKSLPCSKTRRTYLTQEEKLEMRAILEKEDTEAEEDSSVEIENEKSQDCLGDDLGSNPNFIAKFGSDSATYTCNECETPFEKKQQMEWHINSIHLNEKPYKCNLCGASFFIDSQLKQHLKRTHRISGEKIPLFE